MKKVILHAFAALLLLHPGAASAQFAPLTIAGGGIVASKLIDQLESTANQIVDRGAQHGDALLSKIGNEMRVATRNLEIAIGDQRDKTLKDLSPSFQTITDEMNGLIEAANNAPNRATTIAEVANLNLLEFTNRLPFLTKKVDFWVSSIVGLSQVHGSGDYKLTVRGIGFGFAPNNEVRSLKVSINGKDLPAGTITPRNGSETQVVVGNDVLEGLFKDDALAQIPMILTSEITKPRECWYCFLFGGDETKTYSVPLKLVLLPKVAGVVTGFETVTKKVQGDQEFKTTIPHQTSGCSTERPCPWNKQISLANDEVAIRVEHSHSGEGCPFSYAQRTGGDGADYDITDDGRKVVVYRFADGEKPCSTTHTVTYKKVVPKNEDKALGPVQISFGRPFSLLMDEANESCNYRLEAKLSTRQVVHIDAGMNVSADGLLRRIGSAKEGSRCRVTMLMSPPE